MTTLNKAKANAKEHELTTNELDSVSGGCPGWSGPLLVVIVRALLKRL